MAPLIVGQLYGVPYGYIRQSFEFYFSTIALLQFFVMNIGNSFDSFFYEALSIAS
jgi:hypothetical protein